ncbi:glycosyltransferase family 2 protein [uncultured Parolsenella sp.]|uniref:glycosyltransferase family 2 protein n=1 Tax=uncultured Parolsenella sp. TaxID=2083008 RepID=UPI0025D13BDE|nr:glycosyltransferase family 2 protein [uncultured Parolsenella sp.]
MRKPPVLAIVIPCYNEEEVLPITSGLFKAELEDLVAKGKVDPASHVLLVNDGSRDRTWELVEGLAASDPAFRGCSLSRNRGHQNALLGGLMEARGHCDATISIDCDGQDDIATMEAMVDAYLDGCDVVYGVRSSRETDTLFKRFTAQSFYRLLSSMGVECVYNHADYRLLGARALDALAEFREVNLFLRGMVPLVGFRSTSVYYERHERMAGESHYPLSKMLALAVNGITSLSVKPIRLITWTGLFVALASLVAIVWVLVAHATGATVTGWASTTAAVCFMGGVQMLSLGVIGEYVGKIYLESKHRPRYVISERTWESDEEE